MLSKIRKRDGRIADFDPGKIARAIGKAFEASGRADGGVSRRLALNVAGILEERFHATVPSVEDVQDAVEQVLIKEDFGGVAKAYILYRQKRSELREAKKAIGVVDDLKLGMNAVRVLERRYLRKNEAGDVVETPGGMLRRVAKAVASADGTYGKGAGAVKRLEERFYNLLSDMCFLPNSPTLMNAGTGMGQLSACFVVPVEDSMESIFEAVKDMALIHQSGGGTGFSFTRLRPAGDVVRSTGGIASGPVSFMRVFDVATDVIKQGGRRRGANMGILRVDHPDIMDFIRAKENEDSLGNFNLSVGLTDGFVKALKNNREYALINPRTKKAVRNIPARTVFESMACMAWKTGDPGIVFLDEINRHNPTPKLGMIESTNPCGEQPLLPYESCNLGSVNLKKFVSGGRVDWEGLGETVRAGAHFLDNVIDVNRYPLPEIEALTLANRKIGIGVMGFADFLIMLEIPYDSNEALRLAGKLMAYLDREAKKASVQLAKERGCFPNFEESVWKKKYPSLRNATLTTIAPTGSLSIIAGCSSGIEPLFAVSYTRNVLGGMRLLETNDLFEETARKEGFYSKRLMEKIARAGSLREIKGVPAHVKELFVTAHDIEPAWHVRMQAAFQKHTDNAVSKTVNLKEEATPKDIEEICLLACKLKCKGITVYRHASKQEQVLTLGGDECAKSACPA
ncbi:MAG: adenosylcobalamin-dependent ribonucleoside-diphosphate reductase [Candidatus Altiarchaeota archaeon]|nr:adenosylcobalamin-dependent ribonucleoside-diphosphate reductase [Candidatus Altiarchaeota archaeon]